MFISLYGRHLRTASVILPYSTNSPGKVEEKIKKLKTYLTPGKTNFAFMFACLGRGEGLHGEVNVESSIFRKHFPSTPLIGLFGNGEIGCDFYPTGSENTSSQDYKRKTNKKKLYHSYTSVFILFSVGSEHSS